MEAIEVAYCQEVLNALAYDHAPKIVEGLLMGHLGAKKIYHPPPEHLILWLQQEGLVTYDAYPNVAAKVYGLSDKGRTVQSLGLKNYIDRKMNENSPRQQYRVFVSHASKDNAIVDGFVHLLRDPLRVSPEEIFSTSTDGSKISSGEEWRTAIRSALLGSEVVILLLSENYKKSEICLNEMGAAWMSDALVIPIIFPDINFSSVGVLAEVRQVEKLNESLSLDRVKDTLETKLKLKAPPSDLWTKRKNEFLQLCEREGRVSSSTTPHPKSSPAPPSSLSTPTDADSPSNAAITANAPRMNLVIKESNGPSSNRVQAYQTWHVTKTSLCHGSQHTNFQPLSFGHSILTTLSCRVHIHSPYMRFGIKLRRVNDSTFAPNGSIPQAGTILFHIGKEEPADVVHAWVVRDEPIEPKLHVCPAGVGDAVQFKLQSRRNSKANYSILFYVNGLLQFTEDVPLEIMSNIVLLAWRDGKEDAAVDVTNLVIHSCSPS